MLRSRSCIIGLAVMLVGLSTAHAADTVLTLACQGTTTAGTEDAKPEPISMGIIVNFTNRTVQGFGGRGLFGEQCCVQQFLRAVSGRPKQRPGSVLPTCPLGL